MPFQPILEALEIMTDRRTNQSQATPIYEVASERVHNSSKQLSLKNPNQYLIGIDDV